MPSSVSSRDRLLAALSCGQADHVPCCFSGFQILRDRCADQDEYVRRQLDMGLDTMVRINVLPASHDPRVRIREWREDRPGGLYPMLHKEYETPAGTLRTAVVKTEDWPWGDHVPFTDDHLIPRSYKFLATPGDSLDALGYLLAPPTDVEMAQLRDEARQAKALAAEHHLLTVGTYSSVVDMACWLAGIEDLVMSTFDAPDFVEGLLATIEDWNRRRVDLVLDQGVDLVIRRAWYENADFWSPPQFRRFVLPSLRRDIAVAHEAGARFGYLMSCASMPLLDIMMDAGVDVLLGVDPAQDRTMDLRVLKQETMGRMALWGGVCGYLTVERGTPDDIAREVQEAISILAPGGGFILAPVTNMRADTPNAWANVHTLIDTWKSLRNSPLP
jgi:hypothetical protein